jgi:effector-binding domain-containing protein
MFAIGEFARHGRVSVRMLRHYDAIGLLRPAHVIAAEHGAAHNGLSIIDLPAADHATLVHRGPMDAVLPAWQALAHWMDAHGHRSAGPARELYLECPADRAHWVTELQEPLPTD